MTNSSRSTYKELAIPYFKEVFDVIDKVMKENGTPYYLIGATALSLEMLRLGTKPLRGTKDIDFAVMISSVKVYEKLIAKLEDSGFKKSKDPWGLKHIETNTLIDILPFGEIEENNTVNFKNKTELHVLGLKEVLENPSRVEIDEHVADVPGLHGMVILKLIAWSDRPEMRYDDPYDILRIIENYFDLGTDEIYNKHYDLFEGDKFDQLIISARVLGRKIGLILAKSKKLKERILKILEENIDDPLNSKIAETWAIRHHHSIEYSLKLLNELKTGVKETIGNR